MASQKKAKAWKAAGLCVRCGIIYVEGTPFAACLDCREKERERARTKYWQERDRRPPGPDKEYRTADGVLMAYTTAKAKGLKLRGRRKRTKKKPEFLPPSWRK